LAGERNRGLAAGNSPCAGDGFKRHPRHRCPDRRPAARMPDRSLRTRVLGAHHFTDGHVGRGHASRRILRGGRCLRRARSPVRRRCRRRTGAPVMGALRRRYPAKKIFTTEAQRKMELRKRGTPFLAHPLREKLVLRLSNGGGFLLGVETSFLPSPLLTSSSLRGQARRKICGTKIPRGSPNIVLSKSCAPPICCWKVEASA
jgi:hypothetical protein